LLHWQDTTELIPMDEWVQELRVAQEEARKLILANIKSEQQDQVESMPQAGNQVMLQADRRGKGWSKKLSKKWTGPYTIFEVRSPQVVVLEEPNSRNRLTVKVEWIKPFNAATPTALNSSSDDVHYKVEEVLEERTTGTGRHEYKVKWVGYTNPHNSWVVEDLHSNRLLEQFQASRPRTECRTQGTLRTGFRLVGGGEWQLSHGIPIPKFREFQPEMSCAPGLIN